jgi:hypothetical protein
MASIAAFDSTPYAMPSAPSTNCATKPIPTAARIPGVPELSDILLVSS